MTAAGTADQPQLVAAAGGAAGNAAGGAAGNAAGGAAGSTTAAGGLGGS